MSCFGDVLRRIVSLSCDSIYAHVFLGRITNIHRLGKKTARLTLPARRNPMKVFAERRNLLSQAQERCLVIRSRRPLLPGQPICRKTLCQKCLKCRLTGEQSRREKREGMSKVWKRKSPCPVSLLDHKKVPRCEGRRFLWLKPLLLSR